jgi:hypothetical protein
VSHLYTSVLVLHGMCALIAVIAVLMEAKPF